MWGGSRPVGILLPLESPLHSKEHQDLLPRPKQKSESVGHVQRTRHTRVVPGDYARVFHPAPLPNVLRVRRGT
jgi:hypothetical protein